MFIYIVFAIAVISVLWAVWSFFDLTKDRKAQNLAKEKLQKGRILYQTANQTSSSSASESSDSSLSE